MAKVKVDKLGSARRFGARYGSKPKHKFAKIEKEHRKKHKCPYCLATQVKRVSAGIWNCRKCNTKFTGRAYSIKKVIFVEEAAPKEEKVPEEEEDMEEDLEDQEEATEEDSEVEESSEEQAEEEQPEEKKEGA